MKEILIDNGIKRKLPRYLGGYVSSIRVGNKRLSESEQSHVAMLAIKKRAKKSAIRIKNALRRDVGYYRCNELSNDNRFLQFDSFICNKQTAEVK